MFWGFWVFGSKFVKFLMSILKRQVNSISNFASFFIVITHNSPLSFKLIHFLFCIKGSNESPKFENFVCSGENLPNSSCHFPNHKSAFLPILHHILLSWNISPLYLLAQKLYNLVKSSPLKCKFLRLSSSWVKIRKILHVSWNGKSIPLQIFYHSSVICSSCIFYFGQKNPMKIRILTFPIVLMNICQIPHFIF